MTQLFDVEVLEPLLQGDSHIFTPNKRLAVKIESSYANARHQLGLSKWNPMGACSVDEWVHKTWMQAGFDCFSWALGSVVTPTQRRQLFHQIVNSDAGSMTMGVAKLASHADSAYRFMELWDGFVSEEYQRVLELDFEASRKFTSWSDAFNAQLEIRGLVTKESLYSRLTKAYLDGELQPSGRAVLVGFDQVAPAMEKLLVAAHDDVLMLDQARRGGVVGHSCFPDPDCELKAAAKWASQILSKDPNAMIGIIVPELGTCRDKVERIFTQEFEPQYYLPSTQRYTLPFNFSAGTPLLSTPVVHGALAVLGQLHKSRTLEETLSFVNDPFWGDATSELTIRASLVNKLKSLAKPTVTTAELRHWASELSSEGDDTLYKRLEVFGNNAREGRSSNTPSGWANVFISHLKQMGWPGSRRPDSVEYQQIVHFYGALETFSELDSVVTSFNAQQVLQHLSQILAGTPFQPKTEDSPIQILGSLEGAGLMFTHCWVVGMSQSAWPPAPAPNPLLPVDFQRKLGMPRADANRELALAQALTSGYAGSASEQVVFSFPASVEGKAEKVSALVAQYPEVEVCLESGGVTMEDYGQAMIDACSLEKVGDSHGLPLPEEKAKGGTGILKDQSGCPFNAYAKYRLGASSPMEPVYGLTAVDRGNMLHNALAKLWNAWKSQAVLLGLDSDELVTQVKVAVQQQIDHIKRFKGDVFGPRYQALESARLTRLILRFIEVDKRRPPFEVTSIEQSEDCQIGKLLINVRLDRCDTLESGDPVVIDYKTGISSKATQWAGDRPEDPQLPLYSVTSDSKPRGVAFAVVHAEKTEYRGVGAEGLGVKGIQEAGSLKGVDLQGDWDEIVSQWGRVLEDLADEYCSGYAGVTFGSSAAERYATEYLPLNRYLSAEEVGSF